MSSKKIEIYITDSCGFSKEEHEKILSLQKTNNSKRARILRNLLLKEKKQIIPTRQLFYEEEE